MRIAVDGYEITSGATGAGRVIDNLLSELIDLLPEHQFTVFMRQHLKRYDRVRLRQYIVPGEFGYFRWQNGPLRKGLNGVRPDIFIASNYTLPVFCPWRSFLIVHDISIITHPEWYPRKVAFGRNILLRRSLKKASRVVVPSEFTKNEIVRVLRLPAGKVQVITLGIEEKFRRPAGEEIEKWKVGKGLEGKKIIGFLGSIFNRRNVPALVGAVEKLRGEMPDLALYIIGRDMTYPPLQMARMLKKDWIRWEKSIPDPDIPLFYSSLDVFAYLSEYEGFGLPPLEALACGTVPVVRETSSLREIFQGSALMVNSAEPGEIGKVLKTALIDLPTRESFLARFALERAKFSWDRAARELASLIKDNA
jgi:glycosyltransferase involved in cell wall biosynthesis